MVVPDLNSLEHRMAAEQLIRYGFAGSLITLAVAGSYWAMADIGGLDPMLSLLVAYAFFSVVSYVTHGSFSFKGHGGRDRQHVRLVRFIGVSLAGFVLNQFWVWLLVKQCGGPTWWPTIPIIFVSPLIIFILLRRFVYA